MKRAFGVLATAVVVALAPGLAYAQTGPAGDWTLSMTTPQGTNDVGLSISLAGDKVSLELSPYDLTKGRITFRHLERRPPGSGPAPTPGQRR